MTMINSFANEMKTIIKIWVTDDDG